MIASDDDDLGSRVERGADTVEHRQIVVLPELVWHKYDSALDVIEDEEQFTITEGRQDGVDRHSRHGGTEIDDGGLMPVGQHEGDNAAGRHPRQQRLRQSLGLGMERLTVDADIAVDERHPLRRQPRGVDQRVG